VAGTDATDDVGGDFFGEKSHVAGRTPTILWRRGWQFDDCLMLLFSKGQRSRYCSPQTGVSRRLLIIHLKRYATTRGGRADLAFSTYRRGWRVARLSRWVESEGWARRGEGRPGGRQVVEITQSALAGMWERKKGERQPMEGYSSGRGTSGARRPRVRIAVMRSDELKARAGELESPRAGGHHTLHRDPAPGLVGCAKPAPDRIHSSAPSSPCVACPDSA